MPERMFRPPHGAITLCCLLGAACTSPPAEQESPVSPDPACGSTNETSPWVEGAVRFERLASYGTEPGQELFDVWGVGAAPDGRVVVWDAGQTRVLVMSPELALLQSMGGEGRGPGEFVYQKVPHGNWLSVADSTVTVVGLSQGVFVEFGLDGGLVGYATTRPPTPIGLITLDRMSGRIVFAVERTEIWGDARVVETWRLTETGPHARLRADTMPSPPLAGGRPLLGGPDFDQARPLWGLSGACAIVSDGGSPHPLRANLASGTADTLPLPAWPVPERRPEDLALLEAMHRGAEAFAGRPLQELDIEPTLRVRWSTLVVDPAGFVWIAPWRPPSYADEPLTALVLSPRDGTWSEVRVPRFPSAFLPDGRHVVLTSGPLGTPVVEVWGRG